MSFQPIGDVANKIVERVAQERSMSAEAAESTKAMSIVGHQPPLVPSESAAIIHMIERAARDPSIDIDKMERLLAMHERMVARDAEKVFDGAMSECQSKMRAVAADANNPQTKSKYASYFALDKALRPIYTDHGFALTFNTAQAPTDQTVRVICRVSHRDGHGRDYHIDMPADGKGAKGGDVMTRTHATGAAITYGTRYLLKMIFNIAVGEDDDGNSASASGGPINQQQLEKLQALIVEVAADIPRFCKYFKVGSIADIPAKDFGRAVQALEAKRVRETAQ